MSETMYHPAIEDAFETSGPDIGRLKDQTMAIEVAERSNYALRSNMANNAAYGYNVDFDVIEHTNTDVRSRIIEKIRDAETIRILNDAVNGIMAQENSEQNVILGIGLRERSLSRAAIQIRQANDTVEKRFMQGQRNLNFEVHGRPHVGMLGYDDLQNTARTINRERDTKRIVAEESRLATVTIDQFTELLDPAVAEIRPIAAWSSHFTEPEQQNLAESVRTTYSTLSDEDKDKLRRALINVDVERDDPEYIENEILRRAALFQAIIEKEDPSANIWDKIGSHLLDYTGNYKQTDKVMAAWGAPLRARARACGQIV